MLFGPKQNIVVHLSDLLQLFDMIEKNVISYMEAKNDLKNINEHFESEVLNIFFLRD